MKGMRKWFPFKKDKAPAKTEKHPMAQMREELNQLVERFMSNDEMDRWYGDFSAQTFAPTVDIADEKKHLRITAELPGMEEKDIKLTFQDNALVLCGEKRLEQTHEDDGYYRTERSFGSFERVIPLPVEVDAEHAEARFKKGVLTVRLAKVNETPSAKQIPIAG